MRASERSKLTNHRPGNGQVIQPYLDLWPCLYLTDSRRRKLAWKSFKDSWNSFISLSSKFICRRAWILRIFFRRVSIFVKGFVSTKKILELWKQSWGDHLNLIAYWKLQSIKIFNWQLTLKIIDIHFLNNLQVVAWI